VFQGDHTFFAGLVVWILAAGLSSADWLVTEPDGLRCKLTEAGEHYMGTLARASDGSICKMWNTVINLIPTGNLGKVNHLYTMNK